MILGAFWAHFGDLFAIKIVIKFSMDFGSGKSAKKEPTRALSFRLQGFWGGLGRGRGGENPLPKGSGMYNRREKGKE